MNATIRRLHGTLPLLLAGWTTLIAGCVPDHRYSDRHYDPVTVIEPHHGGGGKHGNKYDDYPAGATADDRAWIRECIRDNRHEGQSKRTVTIYCTCMNNRMSDNETRSITQWEKSHPRAMAACEAEAGWR